MLFVDLSGSTGLAEWMEAEHYADLLAQLSTLYEQVVPRHGGAVARIQGDGMLAIFGYPEVREDDGRRATEAALELHTLVRGLRPPGPLPEHFKGLTLHSGIHAGVVFVGEGDAVRGRYELIGNAPNIAARLAENARADEILVSQETLGLQSHYFETSARRQLHLRGRATPIGVYLVKGRSALSRRFEASERRGLTPLQGRAAELSVLDQALSRAFAGATFWVAVRAGAGLGKTRLCEEFLLRVSDHACQVHRGHCESYLVAEPLQPWLQMLRGLEHYVGGPPELALALQAPPEERAERLLALFMALAAETAQLLFIDDLQWADDASLRLLHQLRDHAARRRLPVLLLTASRPALPGSYVLPTTSGADQLIELPPLPEPAAAVTVSRLLPQADPFVAAEVQRHAGGNPLFLEELCHAAAEAAVVGERLGQAQPSAAWLATLIESRVERLPPEQADLVRIAAVIGTVVPTWLLTALTGIGERDPGVQALAEQDFLFPDREPGALRFKHGITRDVVYDSTGLHLRQQLHRRIAAQLRARGGETDNLNELLAYHDAAANEWPLAAQHAEAAGDQALASSALDRAKRQFRAALAALEFLPDTPERRRRWVNIAQRLGMACVFDASRDDLRVLRHAAELAQGLGDTGLIARTDYWLAYVGYALGEVRESLRYAQAAVSSAEACQDSALLAQLPGTVGQIHAAAAHYPEALAQFERAIERQRERADKSRNRVGLAYSLCCKAYVLGDQGNFDGAHAAFAEALDAVADPGHAVQASIQGWRSAVLLWQGRWAEAREAADISHHVGTQVRSMFTCAMGHAASAYAAWMLERAPEAPQQILDAIAWLAPRGGGLFSSFNHGWLAEIFVEQGDMRGARHHIACALARARQQDWVGGAMAYRAAAKLAVMAGDKPRARRCLDLAAKAGARRGSGHEKAVTDWLRADLGLADAGQPSLEAAVQQLQRLGMTGLLSARAPALSGVAR
ncbi:ATP-binding protein [Roseateles sp.]|uniref:ATP-binding protein n=1 Tax=Roseateles sp. TaxID=1971397 RepID=UPI0039647717